MMFSFGEKATLFTRALCSSTRSCVPSLACHTRAVPSLLAEATSFPSALNLASSTKSV